MKSIFTSLTCCFIVLISSCSKDSGSGIAAPDVADSISKGGFVQVSFYAAPTPGTPESFYFNDYTKGGWAVYSLYATTTYNASDSMWHLHLQLTDQKSKQLSFSYDGIGVAAVGTYVAKTNTSTLTDFSTGTNYTYAISRDNSTVNVTQATYPMQGTINFTLYKNSYTTNATGSFTIYH
jgi:hypothetical protein